MSLNIEITPEQIEQFLPMLNKEQKLELLMQFYSKHSTSEASSEIETFEQLDASEISEQEHTSWADMVEEEEAQSRFDNEQFPPLSSEKNSNAQSSDNKYKNKAQSSDRKYKNKAQPVCRHFNRKGGCELGDKCSFAHIGTEGKGPVRVVLCCYNDTCNPSKLPSNVQKCGFGHGFVRECRGCGEEVYVDDHYTPTVLFDFETERIHRCEYSS